MDGTGRDTQIYRNTMNGEGREGRERRGRGRKEGVKRGKSKI